MNKNKWREVFGLQRWCLSQIDPNNMLRFQDGSRSHVFLKLEGDGDEQE